MGFGRQTQSAIYRAGARGREPKIPVRWPELVARAERAMSSEAWAYVHGSSGIESTAEVNADAFDAWRIVPRVLRDVSARDLGVSLFGHDYATPLLAAPVGVLELVDDDADLAIARAAAGLGIPAVLSSQASFPMERVAAEGGGGPLWFQLYWSSSDELVESFVSRAETIGAQAIVVTLDTQMLGWRPRDLDRAFLPFIRGMGIAQYTSDPVFQRLVAERIAARADGAAPRAAKERVTPTRGPHPHRHDPPVSGALRRQPALRRPEGRGRDLPRRLLALQPAVVRPRVPAGAHEAADPAQGDPASG